MQKSSKSDTPDFEQSNKTTELQLFFVVSHMYTRCENRNENCSKIETKTTPNPLENDTQYEPQKGTSKNDTKMNKKLLVFFKTTTTASTCLLNVFCFLIIFSPFFHKLRIVFFFLQIINNI